ncbi:lysylphosphatidylglycerol synthase transmembrane domain-containing protein [Azoarcus sp. CIB]|uniref:lysylphosphatidylglycerol synthase transmembrane domain-containing protein n=1 Tax=Aromatoleum sp. (strain CIB) TaxID=198107 RepID=UPI0009FB3670|nr:lysylphosphatidylglycerol synthase transmembrane domain-containing protein [Azoarcus sp. CIB]
MSDAAKGGEPAVSAGSSGGRARGLGPHLVGWGISGACLLFIASQIKLDEIREALSIFHWPYLLLGVLSLAFGYTMRVVRWALMLHAAGAPIGVGRCFAPFLGSIALNNVLPLRLGDVVRALVFPSSIGLSRVTAAGSLLMERLVDLLTLLVCLGVGLTLSGGVDIPAWVGQTAMSLSVLGGLALVLVFLFSGAIANRIHRFCDEADTGSARSKALRAARDLLRSFELMSRLPALAALFLVSALVWLGETGLFLSVLSGFGLDNGLPLAMVIMAIATLSTLVPSSPGYVGPFHLAAYAAISMVGGSSAQAASFAVLSHLGLWLPTTLAGAVAIAANPNMFRGLRARSATKQLL